MVRSRLSYLNMGYGALLGWHAVSPFGLALKCVTACIWDILYRVTCVGIP